MFKNWTDFNLLECHVRVLPYEGRQEGVQMDSMPQQKSLSQGPDMLPMHPSLSREWHKIVFCLWAMRRNKLLFLFALFLMTTCLDLCLPFQSVPQTAKFNSRNSLGRGGMLCMVGNGWVELGKELHDISTSTWCRWDWQPDHSFQRNTHTHSTLFCVMNSGAGPHNGIS